MSSDNVEIRKTICVLVTDVADESPFLPVGVFVLDVKLPPPMLEEPKPGGGPVLAAPPPSPGGGSDIGD